MIEADRRLSQRPSGLASPSGWIMLDAVFPRDRAWLRGLLTLLLVAGRGDTPSARAQEKKAAAGERRAVAPAPVGAREDVADLVIWSVDDDRSMNRWDDAEWTGHARLLRLLGDAGLRARVEHMTRDAFAERWEDADPGRLPGLITGDRFTGLLRALEEKGRLIHVQSERLTFRPEAASCDDFRGRWKFLVAGSPHEAEARRAAEAILRPGAEPTLPGSEVPRAAGRAEALLVAKRAAIAYVSGDPERLRAVASASSPQLTRCTRPEAFRRGWDVEAGPIEIRGNEAIAFARVEMRFRGKTITGADPVAVVLRREGPRWKAFSVGHDVYDVDALPDLCRLALRPLANPQPPPTPRLVYPDDGGPIGPGGRAFAWDVPAGGEPLAAQVGEVLLDEAGASWPSSRIRVYPGEPRDRAIPLDEPALLGVTSAQMRWCVWTIGVDGRISASEVRRYRRARF
jgi:hypothetical protein